MDLSHPIHSVIPSAHGEVLAVLARTSRPLTGRRVAALTDGRVSAKGANLALRALVAAGIVLVEDHPPAKLYQLNRRHLAAEAIIALADLRPRLLDAMRGNLANWERSTVGAWLFGSAARGEGSFDSDIDVLVVRPADVDSEDPVWTAQLAQFAELVEAWTGNTCSVIEYSEDEYSELMSSGERLGRDLRSEGIALTPTRVVPPRIPGIAT